MRRYTIYTILPVVLLMVLLTVGCERAVTEVPADTAVIPAGETDAPAKEEAPEEGSDVAPPEPEGAGTVEGERKTETSLSEKNVKKVEEIKPNEILVKDSGLVPESISIGEGEKVTFRLEGQKRHKIACYLGSKRVILTEDLTKEKPLAFTFEQRGEYVCIDVIYGLRGKVLVGDTRKNPITGMAVAGKIQKEMALLYVPVAIIAILAFVCFFVGRKSYRRR